MTDQDDTWLAEMAGLSPDEEVIPGVTVAQLAAFHARPPTPSGCAFEPDVAYTTDQEGHRRCLDAYRHPGSLIGRPGVLFVHGGGWERGHRYSHIRRACLLAGAGWVTATMSYRLSSEATWPAPLADVKAALRWMRARATWLGLDPDRLAIAGDSAGAHLAAMAALAPGPLPRGTSQAAIDHAEQPDVVSAAALWCPLTHLAEVPGLRQQVTALIGSARRKALTSASPIAHVSPGAPPVVSFAGAADAVVPVESVVRFHDALSKAGVPNQLHVYPNAGHAFDFDPALWDDTFDKFMAFLLRFVGAPD